jgi:hypothetical protein
VPPQEKAQDEAEEVGLEVALVHFVKDHHRVLKRARRRPIALKQGIKQEEATEKDDLQARAFQGRQRPKNQNGQEEQ